jgi:hypothetical protein
LENLSGDASALANQAEENLLRAYEIMSEAASFLLCQHDDFNSLFSKALKHDLYPLPAVARVLLILAQPS